MKRIFIALLCLPTMAFSQNFKADVKNFNFNYKIPLGEGVASSFSMESFEARQEVRVAIEKLNEEFFIKVSGAEEGEFNFKNPPAFIKDAESMTIRGFNLSFQNALSINLNQADFVSPDNALHLQNFSLGCQRNLVLEDLMDQVISGCTQGMNLKSSRFSSSEEALSKAIVQVVEKEVGPMSGIGVNSLDMRVSGGRYDLSAEIKAQISGKIKSKGELSYDAAKKELRVKISSVKYGFFNITSKVFDELEKKESEKMKVSKPYVYFKLK
jgi:hypothetical protein